MRIKRPRASVFLAILCGGAAPELVPLASRIVRREWAKSRTMVECAKRLRVSRESLQRLRAKCPRLFDA